jgi:hypothetical protein
MLLNILLILLLSGQYAHWKRYHVMLVGGLEHFLFFHILEIIIPTQLTFIFFRGVETTNQSCVLDLISFPMMISRFLAAYLCFHGRNHHCSFNRFPQGGALQVINWLTKNMNTSSIYHQQKP